MDDDRFAWVRQSAETAVLDGFHPAHAAWMELDEVERWIAEGAPADESPPLPAAPQSVELPAVALAVSREQAAALLSISVDTFERRVLPHLRVAQVGRRQLVPVREREAWLSSRTARALG